MRQIPSFILGLLLGGIIVFLLLTYFRTEHIRYIWLHQTGIDFVEGR